MAVHTKAFDYPVAENWGENRNVQPHEELNGQHIGSQLNALPTEPSQLPRFCRGFIFQLGVEVNNYKDTVCNLPVPNRDARNERFWPIGMLEPVYQLSLDLWWFSNALYVSRLKLATGLLERCVFRDRIISYLALDRIPDKILCKLFCRCPAI